MENMDSDKKICSFCGEDISTDYKRCPYCGSLVQLNNDNFYQSIEDKETIQAKNEEHYNLNKAVDENDINRSNTNALKEETKEHNLSFKEQSIKEDKNDEIEKNILPNKPESHNNIITNEERYKESLSNGKKVFLTAIFTLIPGIGQLAGVITAIIYMNIEDDNDSNSFGLALLISSLITFVLVGIGVYLFALALGKILNTYG